MSRLSKSQQGKARGYIDAMVDALETGNSITYTFRPLAFRKSGDVVISYQGVQVPFWGPIWKGEITKTFAWSELHLTVGQGLLPTTWASVFAIANIDQGFLAALKNVHERMIGKYLYQRFEGPPTAGERVLAPVLGLEGKTSVPEGVPPPILNFKDFMPPVLRGADPITAIEEAMLRDWYGAWTPLSFARLAQERLFLENANIRESLKRVLRLA